jgi:hypothetical protein
MSRPIAVATRGWITGDGISPLSVATRGWLTLMVVPVPSTPTVILGGETEEWRDPRRLRLRREDDEILAVIMAIHGETTWRA